MTKNQAVNMLKEIKKLATEGSLTGALSEGAEMLINAYNSIRQKAIGEKWIDDDGIIPVLDNKGKVSLDTVGCAAALLRGLLLDE